MPKGDVFSAIKKKCEVLLEDMRRGFQELNATQLMDLKLWREFAHPNFYSDVPSYYYMGRRFTGKLIRYIMEDLGTPLYYTNRSAGLMKYISGTPGYGKTVSLNTAFTYLYLRSVKAMEERQLTVPILGAQGGTENMHPGEMKTQTLKEKLGCGGESKPETRKRKRNPDSYDVSNHRFLLLSGTNFVQNPCKTLYVALVSAFIKDPKALAMLEDCDSDSQDDLSEFLSLRSEMVHIILDDGNALDEEDADTSEKKNAKSDAFHFLLSLQKRNVKLVICASVRSRLRKLVLKESARYYIGAGGFSEEEVCEYISRVTEKTDKGELRKRPKSIYRRTGWVPRLVAQFISNKRAYQDTRRTLADDLHYYITSVEKEENPVQMINLLTAIAGGRMDPLSDVVDSRCYFRGRDKKSHCLTRSLHSRALGFLTERARHTSTLTGLERVSQFMRVIAIDNDLVRIGWNSEAATLLVLKLLKARVPSLDLIIEPDQVRIFRNRLTRERVIVEAQDLKTLFIPEVFDHSGADVYYVTCEAVVVFQITVAANPERSHSKTEEVARALFEGERRLKAVVWNVVCDSSRIEEPSAAADFYRVYVPFGELHASLACIDEKVMDLRKKQGAQRCPQCKLEGGPGEQIACDFCGEWYHKSCVVVEDFHAAWYCRECEILDTEEEEGEEEPEPEDEPSEEFTRLLPTSQCTEADSESTCRRRKRKRFRIASQNNCY